MPRNMPRKTILNLSELGPQLAFTLVETPLGTCALVYSDKGLRCLLLPEKNKAELRAKARARAGGAGAIETKKGAELPLFVVALVQQIQNHMQGILVDYTPVPLDIAHTPAFHGEVWAHVRSLPAGITSTYGEVARALGKPGAARAVGQAMANNPVPLVVPCHRVMGAESRMVGFSAYGGVAFKEKLLHLENAFGADIFHPTDDLLPECAERASAHLAKRDKTMGRLLKLCGHIALERPRPCDPFRTLLRSIVGQQLSTKAASTIHARVVALFAPKEHPTPEDLQAAEDTFLRNAGLSRGKVLALKDLAAKTLTGVVPDSVTLANLSDEAIVERLTAIHGIGRWTVEMLLIFGLGRPNVMPATDLGVRKGYALVYKTKELPEPAELLELGRTLWHPYQSLAALALWRSLEVLPPKAMEKRSDKNTGKK